MSQFLPNDNSKTHLWLQYHGYHSIFYNQSPPDTYQPLLIQYFQQLNNLLTSSTTADSLILLKQLQNSPSSILLNHFPFKIGLYQKRKIKQAYTKMVHIWANRQDEEGEEITRRAMSLHCLRMFPHQLFNLMDKPMMRALIEQTNFINRLPVTPSSNLSMKDHLSQIEQSLYWLSRFNIGVSTHHRLLLQTLLHLQDIVTNKLKQLHRGQLWQNVLIVSNCLYLLIRKLLNIHSYHHSPNKQLLNHLKHIIKTLYSYLPPKIHQQQIYTHFCNAIQAFQNQQNDKTKSGFEMLAVALQIKSNISYSYSITQCPILHIKFIRLHQMIVILTQNCSEELYRSAQRVFRNRKVVQIIKQNAYEGNFSAELLYVIALSKEMSGSQADFLVSQSSLVHKEMLSLIPKYNKAMNSLMEVSSNQEYQINRLLSYENSLLTKNTHNHSNQTKCNPNHKIIQSLLNDSEFAASKLFSKQLEKAYQNALMKVDPRITLNTCSEYPFFGNFELVSNEGSQLQKRVFVWMESSLGNKSRVVDMYRWRQGNSKMINEKGIKRENLVVGMDHLNETFDRVEEAIQRLVQV